MDDELRRRLLAIAEKDQAHSLAVYEASQKVETHRGKFLFDIPIDEWLPEYFEPPEAERQRTESLRQVIGDHGWPGHELVGADGCRAAWMIAQHGGADPDFQRECQAALAVAVARGDAPAGQLAALRDRIELEAGRTQLYGTHLEPDGDSWRPVRGINDAALVDARRAELGLKPWAEYLADCLAGKSDT